MIRRFRLLHIFLVVAVCLGMGLSTAGCEDDDEESLRKTFTDTVSLRGDSDMYMPVGAKRTLVVHCDPEENRPVKPVYVWRIFCNGNLIEEITHDSDTSPAPQTVTGNGSSGSKQTWWPEGDVLVYTWEQPGTYKIEVDLYDYEQYSKNRDMAELLSNHTHTVQCDYVKPVLEATPTEKSRTFDFKVTVENPKFLSFGAPVKWEFVDESTGQADNGPTDEISMEDSLFKDGYLEIEHTFRNAGSFKVKFITSSSQYDYLIVAETVVDVSREMQIIVPPGPLKAGKEITFTARTDTIEKMPDEPSYEWLFGDGEGLAIPFTNESTYVYKKPGTYKISVKLFESEEEAAPLLGVANTEVTIEEGEADFLGYLQQTKYMSVTVCGESTYHESDGLTRDQAAATLVVSSGQPATTWTGTHFSHSFSRPVTDSSGGFTVTVEGDVSNEGDKVVNLTATYVGDASHRVAGEKSEARISVVNIKIEPTSTLPAAFDPDRKVCFRAYIEGPDVAKFVTNTFFEHVKPWTGDPDFKTWYDPLQFADTKVVSYLLIVFKTEPVGAADDPGYGKR